MFAGRVPGMTLHLDTANIVGLTGSALMVVAFAYSNLAKVMNLVLFNMLNLVGAIMLGASLWVHFNVASFSLEIVWGVIALFGLAKSLIARSHT